MKINFQFWRKLFEVLVLIITVLIANRRAWNCLLVPDFSLYYCDYGNRSTDVLWWLVAVMGSFLLLIQSNLLKTYILSLKSNKLLLVFLAYLALSLTWTDNLTRSLHSLLIFVAAVLVAGVLATLYTTEKIFQLLLWFAGLTSLLSLLLIIFLPQAGITRGIFLSGTWRGIFTHKNYFGSIMALDNGLFLLALFHRFRYSRAVLISPFFYILTIFLVVMSQSATGLITLICLNSITMAYYLWLKFKSKLQLRHYKMLAIASAVMTGLIFLNLNFLLSMVGRNSTFTGRWPLWEYLFRDVISKRPWFGYGLETVWYERTFQVAAGNAAKWGMIVINSHSGYIDLLVYLGSIGLTLFLMLVIQSSVRVSRYVLSDLEPQSPKFVAFLILVYVLIANTTISYIVEFESFHWLLFVLSLFIATIALQKPSVSTISSRSLTL